jgi:hypothetical protein
VPILPEPFSFLFFCCGRMKRVANELLNSLGWLGHLLSE